VSTNRILLLQTRMGARPRWVPGFTQRLSALSALSAQQLQRTTSPSGPGNKPDRERISSLHSDAPDHPSGHQKRLTALTALTAHIFAHSLPSTMRGREKTKFDHLHRTKDLAHGSGGLRRIGRLRRTLHPAPTLRVVAGRGEPRVHPLRSRPLRNNSERRVRLQPCRKWRGW
jgi:hypothetical protein